MSSGGTPLLAENKSVSWGFSSLRRFCRLRMSIALFSNATAATCLCRSSFDARRYSSLRRRCSRGSAPTSSASWASRSCRASARRCSSAMGSWSVYQRLRGTCFSRRFGRWEPGPVGGMGVGFGEGALTRLFGGVSIFSARECALAFIGALRFCCGPPARVYKPAFASRGWFLQQVLSLWPVACIASRRPLANPWATR